MKYVKTAGMFILVHIFVLKWGYDKGVEIMKPSHKKCSSLILIHIKHN